MTIRRRRLTAVGSVMSAAVAVVLAVTTGGGADASPHRAAPAVRPAGVKPAWLKTFQDRAVLHTRYGQVVPLGPDPRLADGLHAPDVAGWARKQALEQAAAESAQGPSGRSRTTRPPVGKDRLAVTEAEKAGTSGTNDTPATAQPISGFGTGRGLKNAADVSGNQSAAPVPALDAVPPSTEDDSSPENARNTGIAATRQGITTTGTMGDNPANPDGTKDADSDFYALDLTAGQLVTAKLRTTSGSLQPILALVDGNGSFLTDSFFDPDFLNPSITYPIRTSGRYYLVVAGFTIIDLGTNQVTLPDGTYALDLFSRRGDTDVYAVDLAAGDVLGTNVAGSATVLSILDGNGTELMGSMQDASGAYPTNTPLPGGGNAVADLVAPRAGRYFVSVAGGDGPYTLTTEAYRPGGTGKVRQTIFLDYDGQRLNTNSVFGRGVTTLSPLSSFLAGWGLTPADRIALGKKIKATVVENVQRDLVASGLGASVAVDVVTSDEVRTDPYGAPGVMRVVVGGTIAESGVPTIGIAQDIDPGNFFREETALVLLDSLSEPGSPSDPDNSPPYSLNTYMNASSNRVAFVGQAVGNVVSHEIGHTLGNFHTDNSDAVPSLMDAGGFGFPSLFGVGPDGIGGTADDTDTDFVTDGYDLFEGFTGQEDTTARTAWALSSR